MTAVMSFLSTLVGAVLPYLPLILALVALVLAVKHGLFQSMLQFLTSILGGFGGIALSLALVAIVFITSGLGGWYLNNTVGPKAADRWLESNLANMALDPRWDPQAGFTDPATGLTVHNAWFEFLMTDKINAMSEVYQTQAAVEQARQDVVASDAQVSIAQNNAEISCYGGNTDACNSALGPTYAGVQNLSVTQVAIVEYEDSTGAMRGIKTSGAVLMAIFILVALGFIFRTRRVKTA